MTLHPPWIPKYVIRYLINVNMNSIILYCIFHCIDTYYILWSRLHAIGLLPLVAARGSGSITGSSCMLDWWHPETHTFHFPWG
jgi:hypothetical protein